MNQLIKTKNIDLKQALFLKIKYSLMIILTGFVSTLRWS